MTKKNMENGEGEKKKLNRGNMVKVRKVLLGRQMQIKVIYFPILTKFLTNEQTCKFTAQE